MRPIDADALRPTKIVERKRVFKDGRIRMEAVCTDVYRKNEIDNAPTIKPETEALERILDKLKIVGGIEKVVIGGRERGGRTFASGFQYGIETALEIVKEELGKETP